MIHHAPIILASQSPRRKQLLEWAEIPFRVEVSDADEQFPEHLSPEEAAIWVAAQKAAVIQQQPGNETAIIIAADTMVGVDELILGKAVNEADALHMLQLLSGRRHRVITGVDIRCGDRIIAFADTTFVDFHPLEEQELRHYIQQYQPFDKAGAYAIQEWIGVVGIREVHGDFYNVMGLPVSRVVQALRSLQH